MRDTIDTRSGPVMLDVTGLSYCDARGLSALLRMSSHAQQAGSSLYLRTPPPRLVKLIRITGLDQELPVHCAERPGEVALARAGHHRNDLHSADEVRRGYCLLPETSVGRLPRVIVQAVAGAGPITPASGTGGPTPPLPALVQYMPGRPPPGRALPKR